MKIKPIQFRIHTKQNNHKQCLFFLAYGLYLIASVWDISFFRIQYGGIAYKWVLFFIALLLIVNESLRIKIRFRAFAFAIITILILCIIYITHNSDIILNQITWILLFILAARDIEFQEIADFTLKLDCLIFTAVLVCTALGVLRNYVEAGARIRYYLGFRYSLYPSIFLSNITALIIWIQKDQIRWLTLLFLFGFNIVIYELTNSRLAFGLCMFMLLCATVMKWRVQHRINIVSNKKHIHIGKIAIFSFIICLIVSVSVTYAYSENSNFQNRLNDTLGGRLELGQDSLKQHGVKPFGQAIKMSGNALNEKGHRDLSKTHGVYNYVDCMYIQMLQNFGWVVTTLIIALMTIAMYRAHQKQDHYLLMIGVILAIHGIIDDAILNVYQNTFWLVIAPLVIRPWIKKRSVLKQQRIERKYKESHYAETEVN